MSLTKIISANYAKQSKATPNPLADLPLMKAPKEFALNPQLVAQKGFDIRFHKNFE